MEHPMADERNEDGPRGTVPSMPAAALNAGFATRVDPGAFRRELTNRADDLRSALGL